MPSNYTPSPIIRVLGATVSALVNGDPVNRDNLYVEASPGGTPKLTLGYLLRCIDGILTSFVPDTGVRSANPLMIADAGGSPFMAMGQAQTPANGYSTGSFEPPDGRTLTTVTFYVNPDNATPPAGTKVRGKVYKLELATQTETQIGTTTTDPTTGASYGAAHSFDVDCASEVIDRTAYVYYAVLTGEVGSGADACTWIGSTYTTT